jgi:hypothetical protein
MSHGKLPKAGDDNSFADLKGGLKQLQNPIQQPGGLFLRDSRLLLDSPGDVNLLHGQSLIRVRFKPTMDRRQSAK